MKTNVLKAALLVFAILGVTLTSCQKDKDDTNNSGNIQQQSQDANSLLSAGDEAINDANSVLSGDLKKSGNTIPCNATLDSTSVINDTITYFITYNGLNCYGNKFRSGLVEVKKKANTYWMNAGTSVTVKFINFQVTHVNSGISITLNGQKTFTNISGGLITQLGFGTVTSVIHRVNGNMQVTFPDESTRVWKVARQRVFTGTQGNLAMSVEGFGSQGTYNNLVVWGVNRQNENFFTQISQSIVHKQSCGWDASSGVLNHSNPDQNLSATITFGFDNNNNPLSGEDCPTKYKVDWQKNSNSGTVFLFLP